MTYSISELRQSVLRLKHETPKHLSPLALNGTTTGFREAIEDLLYTVHGILDIMMKTYNTLDGVRLPNIDNEEDYSPSMNE